MRIKAKIDVSCKATVVIRTCLGILTGSAHQNCLQGSKPATLFNATLTNIGCIHIGHLQSMYLLYPHTANVMFCQGSRCLAHPNDNSLRECKHMRSAPHAYNCRNTWAESHQVWNAAVMGSAAAPPPPPLSYGQAPNGRDVVARLLYKSELEHESGQILFLQEVPDALQHSVFTDVVMDSVCASC